MKSRYLLGLSLLSFLNCGSTPTNIPYHKFYDFYDPHSKINLHDNNKIICAVEDKVFKLNLLGCNDPGYDYKKGNIKYNAQNGVFIQAQEGDIIEFSLSLEGGTYDYINEFRGDGSRCFNSGGQCFEIVRWTREDWYREGEEGIFKVRILKLEPFSILFQTYLGRTIELGINVNYDPNNSRCTFKLFGDDDFLGYTNNTSDAMITAKKNQYFKVDVWDLVKDKELWKDYVAWLCVDFYDENENWFDKRYIDPNLEKCNFPDFVGLAIFHVETAGGRKEEFWVQFKD